MNGSINRTAAVLVLGVAAGACGTSEEPVSLSSVQIEADDFILIGSVDGPLHEAFEFIVDADELASGEVILADRMPGELRVFSRTGEFRGAYGGSGQGPSEFTFLESFLLRGDTVVVSDPRAMKVARFLTGGEFVRSDPTEIPGATLVGITSTGLEVWSHVGESVTSDDGVSEWTSLTTVSDGRGNTVQVATHVGGWRYDSPYPTSPVASTVMFRDSVLIADPGSGVLRLVSPDGGGERMIHPELARPERESAWAEIEAELVRRDLADLARDLDEIPARPIPAFGQVLVRGETEIWVKHYDPLEDAHWLGGWAGGEGGTYLVLDAEGRPLREVTLSARVVPLRLTEDLLIGRYRDELDVQYLALMELD